MIFEKEGRELTLAEFEKVTGAKWVPHLVCDPKVQTDIAKKGATLHRRGELTLEQLWLGSYYKKELLHPPEPDIALRWINPHLGWGAFALRSFKKGEFIAEYAGKVRKREKKDEKNSYCFEYLIAPGFTCPYTIDAMEQGGVGRFLNHSSQPNLFSKLATLQDLCHVIFYVKEPIAMGEQLCYDYGPDYWSKRCAPTPL